MVGMRFSKCLQCKVLLESVLFLTSLFLLANGRAFGLGVASAVASERPTSPLAKIEMKPEAISFVDVPVGDTYTQTVRITNLGESTLQIKKISASTPDFRITGIFVPVVVAHGTSETFTISFHAKAEGLKEGQISIFTSDDDLPLVFKVNGSGIAAESELTASAAAIDFEDVAVGSIGKQELTLTNSGARDLTISSVSVAGAEFNVSGITTVRLTPGQSVNLEVNFAPKRPGPQNGQLTISTAEGNSSVLMPLTGSGAASSQNVVKLNWEESPVTVAGYVVYRSTDSSGPYTRISQAMTPEFVDTGLAAGHTYYYVVTSLDGGEVESEYSPPISATVPEG